MTQRDKIGLISGQEDLSQADIGFLLSMKETGDIRYLGELASTVKAEYVGRKVYFRGLIEFSNICSKDCFYCGIRRSNEAPQRYFMSKQEILDAALFDFNSRYGSIVLQSGERSDPPFTRFISEVVKEIKDVTGGKLGITLSCGEQSPETYRDFFKAGAHRYLLRIETSDRDLYKKLHPDNKHHDFDTRLECLHFLRKTGFQVGTGVMVGLPFQTMDHLVRDILFLKKIDADMIGLGPYVEHSQTPLYDYRDQLWSRQERLMMTLKTIAIVRIMMKDINIASATALQSIDGFGRERALKFGANIIMPSLTPGKYRKDYLLYEDKPCIEENREECRDCLETRIKMVGDDIGYDKWGDPVHFKKRNL
jgi:biotin synthase